MREYVDTFMGLIAAERWQNDSRFGKAWLRVNLAARCERDPFVPLRVVFRQYRPLIPATDASFDRIADVLAGFDRGGARAGE
jgi:hypothetical protein